MDDEPLEAPIPCVFVTGDIADGFSLYGPYPSFDAAAAAHLDDEVGITIELFPPAAPASKEASNV